MTPELLVLFLHYVGIPVLLGTALELAAKPPLTWVKRSLLACAFIFGTLLQLLPPYGPAHGPLASAWWWLFRLSLFWFPAALVLAAARLPFFRAHAGALPLVAPLLFILGNYAIVTIWINYEHTYLTAG